MELYILGGDLRSSRVAEYFTERGWLVHTTDVPGWRDEPLPESFRRVILPFPAFRGDLLRGREGIPIEEVLCRVNAETVLFGGCLGSREACIRNRGGSCFDLYNTEPLTTENAALTAEGAIGMVMERCGKPLQHSRCLVIGWGRIGKLLSHKLRGLSAEVTVTARREGDLALAEALGFDTDRTGVYDKGLKQYDYIFNTVPNSVLSREQIGETSENCVLMELASAPFGMQRKDCEGRQYIYAPGIPGQRMPMQAGECYARAIEAILKGGKLI